MALIEKLNEDKKESNGQFTGLNLQGQDSAEIIEPAVQEKTVRVTTFILVAAIVAVLAVIWVIHKKAVPAKATAAVTDQQLAVETAITQLTGIKSEDVEQVDQLVKRFYEFADFVQVSPKQFKRNPFGLPSMSLDSSYPLDKNNEVKNESQKMQLRSIIESKNGNCCMIDDAFLYKGDKINGFKITEIGADFVKLTSQGQSITLYLQTE